MRITEQGHFYVHMETTCMNVHVGMRMSIRMRTMECVHMNSRPYSYVEMIQVSPGIHERACACVEKNEQVVNYLDESMFPRPLRMCVRFHIESKSVLLSCLLRQARHILDRFCFALRLIQAPNKRAGYQLVASKTIHRTMMM